MKKSCLWIPVAVAATANSFAETSEKSAESRRCDVKEVPVAVESMPSSDAELEAVALDLILRKHGGVMTEVEKSSMAAAVARLEKEANQSTGTMCVDLGVAVAPLDEATRRLIQPEIEGGLRVTQAKPGGVLSFWGVGPHDLIVATNGKSLHNAKALQDVLDDAVRDNKPVLLDVIAQGNRRTINLLPLRDRAKLKPGAPRFWQLRGC